MVPTPIVAQARRFASWYSALRLCAQSPRASSQRSDQDCADIIELRVLADQGHHEELVAVAGRALARNPTLAYAYLMLCTSCDKERNVRTARAGLMCPVVPPFVRAQLLWQSVMNGVQVAFRVLQDQSDPASLALGSTFLETALENTETFIAEAAPDSFWLLPMLNWRVIITLILRGPTLGEDLEELQV